jgi:hypothetical protein
MSEHIFRKPPPLELISRILKPLNIYLDLLPTQFSKKAVDEYKWSTEDLAELSPYYYPSILDRFFENDYPKSSVTVIRQLLKAHNYEFKTVETMAEYKKSYIYHISEKKNKPLQSDIIMHFD